VTTHDDYLVLAATAIDFPLSADEQRGLAAHLAACPSCAQDAAALRGDAARLSRFGETDAPSEIRAAVAAAAANPKPTSLQAPVEG
jgi:hypothetical protein